MGDGVNTIEEGRIEDAKGQDLVLYLAQRQGRSRGRQGRNCGDRRAVNLLIRRKGDSRGFRSRR
eukprot:2347519-Prymnesium_polylepis.1